MGGNGISFASSIPFFNFMDGHVPTCCVLQVQTFAEAKTATHRAAVLVGNKMVLSGEKLVAKQQAKTYIKRGRGRKMKHNAIRTGETVNGRTGGEAGTFI